MNPLNSPCSGVVEVLSAWCSLTSHSSAAYVAPISAARRFRGTMVGTARGAGRQVGRWAGGQVERSGRWAGGQVER